MAWLIVCFSDLTVSRVSEKWLKKSGKKCYFPKTNVAMKIKTEAAVDKKSGKWGLHVCRILMHGKRFATLSEARKAEKIAQNHSTMTSFEASYAEKQELRKHPNVFHISSASESESDDFKNIGKLKKLDSGSTPLSDKEYIYKRSDSSYENDDNSMPPTNHSFETDTNDDYEGESPVEEDVEDVDMNINSGERSYEQSYELENNSGDDVDQGNENSFGQNSGKILESTSELRSPAAAYDFSDDRCLVRIEKLIMHACQELESIKNDMKALKIKSSETEQVVENLVLVCKDLCAEVFSCTEELKKRNGMFTDLLVPDLKLPVNRRKYYKKNELALAKMKIADNMIKYLASTINEKKEKKFIQGCFNAIFDTEFLTNKVWWKSEPGKVLIKKSQILHCMKESFKLKYGLVEPKKTDKEIEKLIYNTCRNIKDGYRKALKKAQEATEKAEKKSENAKLKQIVVTEIDDVDHLNESDCNYEDENYNKQKKAKKAARKAEKARLAAEEFDRAAKKAKRAAEKAKLREDMEDIPVAKHNRKRLASCDDFEPNIVAKEHKKKH